MPITTLPPEILHQCLGHLGEKDLARASLVCRAWLEPSRDHYWSNLGLNIMDTSAEVLAPVLGEGTMVPRKINGFRIDESDDLGCRDAEETTAWQTNLVRIMGHFSAVSELTISCLDLSQFPAGQRAQVLQPGQVNQVLIIQWLKVEHVQETTSFILNQPNINFLGIGNIYLAKNDKDKDIEDGDVETSEGESEKKNERGSAGFVLPSSSSEHVTRLGKLRHLCLFSGPGGLTWSHVVPLLAKGRLTELKTLIAECHNRDAFSKLIDAAAPALRSVAVSFQVPGIKMDLSEVRSLSNLGIDLSHYPSKEYILTDTVATVSSAPPSLENVFINIGPATIEPEKQPDDAHSHWAVLDAVLAGLPRLCRIVVIVVFDSCTSMFIGMRGRGGDFIEKWKGDALNYVKYRLPVCDAKGVIEVRHVTGSWTSGAFANHRLPE